MARPKKNNADYFPHDADMRNDPKIRALRRKFGLKGYAIWNMFLESLTNSEYFESEWNEMNIELLAGDYRDRSDRTKGHYYVLPRHKTFKLDGEKIYSKKLIDRFESLLVRRKRQRKTKEKELSIAETPTANDIGDQNSQSKEKESKGDTPKEYSEKEFLSDWNEQRKKHLNKPSYLNLLGKTEDKEIFRDLKRNHSREDFQNALVGLFKQKKFPQNNISMQSNPSHFLKYFNSYITAFHDKNTNLYGKVINQTP